MPGRRGVVSNRFEIAIGVGELFGIELGCGNLIATVGNQQRVGAGLQLRRKVNSLTTILKDCVLSPHPLGHFSAARAPFGAALLQGGGCCDKGVVQAVLVSRPAISPGHLAVRNRYPCRLNSRYGTARHQPFSVRSSTRLNSSHLGISYA